MARRIYFKSFDKLFTCTKAMDKIFTSAK